jgi:putative membrane protein
LFFLGLHYTYAEVPLGFWAQKAFGLARNDYDRVGHFFQGFVPAMVTREVLLRMTPLRRGAWLSFLVVSVCLAFSALYELVEWGVAVTQREVLVCFSRAAATFLVQAGEGPAANF